MKVSLIQIESNTDKESNFAKAKMYISEAMVGRADIICLSENFLYRGEDKLKESETLPSRYIDAFQRLAEVNKVNLVLWSIALETWSGKITNSSLIIDRRWKIIHRYDKIYMYDVERDDLTYRESDETQAGKEIWLFELDGNKMGVWICVDLRYPEYFRKLIQWGAKIIFLPSNFRKLTGQLARDVLTRARAIENQAYFCACWQTGGTGAKERCWNSRIISFDGRIISEINEEEGLVSATIDLDALYKFRREFPVLRQM